MLVIIEIDNQSFNQCNITNERFYFGWLFNYNKIDTQPNVIRVAVVTYYPFLAFQGKEVNNYWENFFEFSKGVLKGIIRAISAHLFLASIKSSLREPPNQSFFIILIVSMKQFIFLLAKRPIVIKSPIVIEKNMKLMGNHKQYVENQSR